MFGIGLPEMILILALALIVVGPDKLPDLARSLAKGLMELKKTAEGLKETMADEQNPLNEIKPDLEEAAKTLKDNLLDSPYPSDTFVGEKGVNPANDSAASAYDDLMKTTGKISEDGRLINHPPQEENKAVASKENTSDGISSSQEENRPTQ